MERLTKMDTQNRLLAYSISDTGLPTLITSGNPYRKLIEKLKSYEDTGLEPGEVMDGKMLTGWISVDDRLPQTEDGYAHVMVSMDDGFVCTTDYTDDDGFELWADSGEVVAWMPLPEPYEPEN